MKLELTKEEVEVVLQALSQQSYRVVAGLIQNIVDQARKQTEVKKEEK